MKTRNWLALMVLIAFMVSVLGCKIIELANDKFHDVETKAGVKSIREEVGGLGEYFIVDKNKKEKFFDTFEEAKKALYEEYGKPEPGQGREEMASGADGECFTADTRVLMADNTFKRIIDVETGDHVQTLDIRAGRITPKPVTNLYYAHQDHYYLINLKLRTTAQHPFFAAEGTWKKARELRVGDRIVSDGEPIGISSIKRIKLDHIVYNFRVADSHNYFVSPDGTDLYVVHNCK